MIIIIIKVCCYTNLFQVLVFMSIGSRSCSCASMNSEISRVNIHTSCSVQNIYSNMHLKLKEDFSSLRFISLFLKVKLY